MKIILQSDILAEYLQCTNIIDYDDKEISSLAEQLKDKFPSKMELIKATYEFVRDEIQHSADIQGEVVTCKASEVLRAKEGICYAKSHLLAALLRYNRIPAGMCYQRLILDDKNSPYLILHGLNAVYIEERNKWIRLDARGNISGVNAQFDLEKEQLAFPVRLDKGEETIPVVFVHPDANVITALTKNKCCNELWDNLPQNLENSKNKHN